MPGPGETEEIEGLWFAALRVLARSWKAIEYRYDRLAPQERDVLSPELHARLVLVMTTLPVDAPSSAGRAKQLAARAVLYAEGAVERVELEATVGEVYAADEATRDMERITAGIASGFVVGYGAAMDDQRRPAKRRR